MFVRIQPSSGMPIARQIADQIRTHCASGALASGDKLPSVRQLAKELTVNQNTVLRVYERLTAEGLIERRHGDGTYVADALPPGRLRAQKELLRAEAQKLARRASDLAISLPDLQMLLQDVFEKLQQERNANGKGGDRHE